MDTTDYPSLPCLSRMHARLAADSRRVEQIVERQTDSIERLFHASTAENWLEVARATQILTQLPAEKLTPEIISEAKNVYGELASFAGGFQKPKHLAKLLAACREVRCRT